MGVTKDFYVVYGWKLPYEIKDRRGIEVNFSQDKIMSCYEGREGEEYSLYLDEGEEYVVFGINAVGSEFDDDSMFNNIRIYNESKFDLKSKYTELFDNEIERDPTLFCFTQYS